MFIYIAIVPVASTSGCSHAVYDHAKKVPSTSLERLLQMASDVAPIMVNPADQKDAVYLVEQREGVGYDRERCGVDDDYVIGRANPC